MATLLDDFLANYSVFYQNIRGYHWNIQGEKFFELHVKFEELDNDLFIKINEVADRVLTLGHITLRNISLRINLIEDTDEVNNSPKAIENILELA